MSTSGSPAGQFLRFAQLVVTDGSSTIDLSTLRFKFEVRASDNETPNVAVIRVYNLKEDTQNTILKQYDSVILTCGYQNGNSGTIFQGDIARFAFGRERNVDSYLEIHGADGDKAYIEAIINQSFPAGTSDNQQLSTIAAKMGIPVADSVDGYVSTGGILPRGKVKFGMARAAMASLATNNNSRWSIQNGVLTFVPNAGYLPGTPIAINTANGMVGTPTATDNGVVVQCYLNPLIKIGQAVQINNKDIVNNQVNSQFYPKYRSQYYPATVTNDGIYRVLVAEHFGDTRGNDWISELTCLSIDPSSAATTSVLTNG
jgi:hypothetical protein